MKSHCSPRKGNIYFKSVILKRKSCKRINSLREGRRFATKSPTSSGGLLMTVILALSSQQRGRVRIRKVNKYSTAMDVDPISSFLYCKNK